MDKRTCTVEGCEKARGSYASGWCPMHYQRWTKHGSFDKPPKRAKPIPKPCSVDGCEGPAHAKSLCMKHYRADYYETNKVAILAKMAEYKEANREEYLARHHDYYRRNRESMLAQQKAKYWEDPDIARAYQRGLNRANPERTKAIKQREYLKNKDRYNARGAAYYIANRDAMREANRRWQEANPEQYRETSRRWRQNNPAKRRELEMRRKARKLGCVVTKADYAAILAEFGMVCHICSDDIPTMADLHFDHVIPLSKGGPHTRANIKPAHAVCNLRKNNKLIA